MGNQYDSTNSITMYGNKGRRRSFLDTKENSLTQTFKNHRHKQTESASLSMAALSKRRKSTSQKLSSRRTSAILGHQLALIPDKKQSGSLQSQQSNETTTYSVSKGSKSKESASPDRNSNLPLNTIITE